MNCSPTRALFGFLFVLALAATAPAQITPALVEGDAVAGVGVVTRIDNLAINDFGQWLVEADTDNANTDTDQVLVRDGLLYLQEGQALPAPAGATLDSFDSINLNNNGDSGWNFFLDGTSGSGDDSGIYFNTALVIQESDISTAPEFTPGTPYIGFFDAKIRANNSNGLMSIASVDDPAIPSSVDRAIVRIQHDGAGNLVSESVLRKEGDIPPGQTEAVADFGTGPHQSAFNDGGAILHFVDLAGATATDGCFYVDDTLLAQEGSASPIGGRNFEFLSSRGCDLSNSGAYIFKAGLDGDTATDEILVLNGAVFRQEGDTLPDIAPFTLTSFGTGSGPVEVDDSGNVLWFGDWNDPDTNVDTGLFRNAELIVQEGVTMIGGLIVDTVSSGSDAFQMSSNGQYAIFEATLAGGINGAFIIELQGPVSITLSQLIAVPAQREVVVSWVTSTEYQHDGFNVYRSDSRNGDYARMNGGLVRGGPEYRFVDGNVRGNRIYWYRIGALDFSGHEELYGPVSARTPAWTRVSGLAPVAPNPFVTRTEMSFGLTREAAVTLQLFDVTGRLVRDFSGVYAAGEHALAWDGRDSEGRAVPAGVYFAKFVSPDESMSRKIVRAGLR